MLEMLIALFGLGLVSLTANSSQIVRLEVEQQADVYNVYVEMDIQKVEDISRDNNGRIMLAMVPGSSSFRSGQVSWEVKRTTSGSRVIHHAKLEPDIRLPAWMGTAIMKDTLQRELRESFENLECLSRTDCRHEPDVTEHEWDDETRDG